MHLRRTALRIFFREAKALGVVSVDPTPGIYLPPRSYGDLRPLTDKEIAYDLEFVIGDTKDFDLRRFSPAANVIRDEPGTELARAYGQRRGANPRLQVNIASPAEPTIEGRHWLGDIYEFNRKIVEGPAQSPSTNHQLNTKSGPPRSGRVCRVLITPDPNSLG